MSDDDPKPDLSFVTTEQLVDELMQRHEGLVVVRENCKDAKGERSECLFDFSGGVSRAIGLSERFKQFALTNNWNAGKDEA